MFKSFRPLLNSIKQRKPVNIHLQGTAVSSHISSTGKTANQFARIRTEYKYPLRAKIADVVHKVFIYSLVGASALFLFVLITTIPLNTEKAVELKAKEDKARELREQEAKEATDL